MKTLPLGLSVCLLAFACSTTSQGRKGPSGDGDGDGDLGGAKNGDGDTSGDGDGDTPGDGDGDGDTPGDGDGDTPGDGDGDTPGDGDGDNPFTCSSGRFDDDNNPNTSCVVWKDCVPGEFVEEAGTPTSDRVCADCPSETFSDDDNMDSCVAFSPCTAGMELQGAGSETEDRLCPACAAGTYDDDEDPSTPCVSCPNGTFSDEEGAISCTNYQTCGEGMEEGEPGTKTRDRTCKLNYPILVSLHDNGSVLDADSRPLAISADGTKILFDTTARASAADTDDTDDLYLRDTVAGTTTLVNVDTAGNQIRYSSFSSHAMSGDGNLVAFQSTNVADDQIYLRNMSAGTTTLVTADAMGNPVGADSNSPRISNNGQYLAFHSDYDFPGGNAGTDVFIQDLSTGEIQKVGDGNLRGLSGNGLTISYASLSSSGTVSEWTTGSEQGLSNQVAATFSNDGRIFGSVSLAQTEVFYVDRDDNTRNRTFDSTREYRSPSLSGDGRYMAFRTNDNEWSVYEDYYAIVVYDSMNGTLERVSDDDAGTGPIRNYEYPRISHNGKLVVFQSPTELTSDDTNSVSDIYIGEIGDDNHKVIAAP